MADTHPPDDVRGRGFRRRATLAEALARVDAATAALPARPAAPAAGGVLAQAVVAAADHPPGPVALWDGYAVRAADTLGADTYNPLSLFPGAAVAVAAGESLPPGTDAVVPVESAVASPPGIEVAEAVAPGHGVLGRGEMAAAGAELLPAGRILRPQDVALLAALGVARVAAVPAPRVRILIAGGPRGGAADADTPLLAALVARDGGVAECAGPLPADRAALAAELRRPGADLILLAGRSGVGPDDVAPLALADAGGLALHGLALRPGGSGGLGHAGGVPVVLLPGDPAACWAVYEALGGRAVRRLAGRPAGLPHPAVRRRARRKLVSEIGVAEFYRVRLAGDDGVEPLASAAVPGAAALARADGFVLIPAQSEGVAPGDETTVRLYDGSAAGLW
ncbi:molybdopterin-binding protein [Azospirillum halopraeferens]|uniref:molybdopterin-binding protein n=1 Tax=Azospirillum halopraeferens TaxID=34010 RepID=UPI0004045B17|nr:molybdopterin-binding protein [Azospirillum halopraeferens]